MEFKLIAPSEGGFLQNIEFNHEEIKKELTERLERYKNIVYADDTIGDAKSDRAALNKFKEAIENNRKEIKKRCLAPYEEFEKKVKEITALIDAPILAIDAQVKTFEEKKRAEKLAEIEKFYRAAVSAELQKILPLEKIANPKWMNVTYGMKTIEAEISEAAKRVKTDLETLESVESEFLLQIKTKYLETLDLGEALREKTRLEEDKARMLAYEEKKRAKEEEERLRRDEDESAESPKPAEAPPVVSSKPAPNPEPEPELERIAFCVWVTREQKAALKEFLKANRIKVGKKED
jgi:hypothetical protein